jgi:hypothetical protein
MVQHSGTAACLLFALTCACSSASQSDDTIPAESGGSGGDKSGVGGASGANAGGSSGNGASGKGGRSMGGGATGGASSGGNTGGGGSTSGGSSTGGGAAGAGAGEPACAAWTADTWRELPSTDAPSAREEPWVIPTEDGMIVFGGYNLQTPNADPFLDDGAIYRVCDDSWTPMSTAGVPHAITDTVAQRPIGIWTGSDLLVWGGFQAAAGGYEEGEPVSFATRYSATADGWSDMSRDGEPTARDYAVRLWTGNQLLVWGGIAPSGDQSWVNHDDGALYDPQTNAWTSMSKSNAPVGRYATDRTVWTGKQLIVWGGFSYETGDSFQPVVTPHDDGGVYDLASDTWTPMATTGAPHGGYFSIVWSGAELIVISKLDGYSMPGEVLFEGARFDPKANAWSAMSAPSLELAGTLESANLQIYWVGSVLAVLGEKINEGRGEPAMLLYDPRSDTWSGETVPSTPQFSSWQNVTVVGDRLIVTGPGTGSADASGAYHESTAVIVFDAKARTWMNLPEMLQRSRPDLVALPERLLVWGGKDIYTDLDAPNPCLGSMGPCDPVTPTIQTLLADGTGSSY